MEFDKTLPRDKLLVQIFRLVQKIPYKVIQFDDSGYACKETVTTNLTEGDCRHKSKLLYNLLMQNNFEAERIKVIFDWKDLPIPPKILGILKKSGTRWSHDAIKMKLSKYYESYIDPTWNPGLKRLGFPTTEEWDGKTSTKQVTNEKLEYFPADDFKEKDHDIRIDKEEVHKFAEALNEWLETSA